MFLPWEAFIRKMIIHSTDMCQELCWVYRDEGWLLPLENEHPDQREIRSVGEGLTEDGWWSETAVHSSQSLEMIVSVKESGWTSWIALARVTAYEGGVRFAQVQLEGKQHEQLQGSSILWGKHWQTIHIRSCLPTLWVLPFIFWCFHANSRAWATS